MRSKVVGLVCATGLILPQAASAISWPVRASGFHCDSMGTCTDVGIEAYQDRTWVGTDDSGSWSYAIDMYGEFVITLNGSLGTYVLYRDGFCADGTFNDYDFASFCRI